MPDPLTTASCCFGTIRRYFSGVTQRPTNLKHLQSGPSQSRLAECSRLKALWLGVQ